MLQDNARRLAAPQDEGRCAICRMAEGALSFNDKAKLLWARLHTVIRTASASFWPCHSLAVQLTTAISTKLQRDVPEALLLEHPDIDSLDRDASNTRVPWEVTLKFVPWRRQ